MTVSSKATVMEQEERRSGGDEEKIERKFSEVNSRVVSKGHNELMVKCKMASGDVVSIGGVYEIGLYVYSNRN